MIMEKENKKYNDPQDREKMKKTASPAEEEKNTIINDKSVRRERKKHKLPNRMNSRNSAKIR